MSSVVFCKRQQIKFYILFVVFPVISAITGKRLTVSQLPVVGTTRHEVYLPVEPFGNFSAVIAERARIATEDSRRLAIRDDGKHGCAHADLNMSANPFNSMGFGKESGMSLRKPWRRIVDRVRSRVQDGRKHLEDMATTSHPAKLFFLFLTRAGENRLDLWQSFFAKAPRDMYRVFMQCEDAWECERKLSVDGDPLNITVVPASRSEYCTDLVSPMVNLLKHSKSLSRHRNDKFVFVSETTLPVKPFSHVYETLAGDPKSDFCFYHSAQWGRVQSSTHANNDLLLLKHSQWVILGKAHAELLVDRWESVKQKRGKWFVPMTPMPGHVASMAAAVSVGQLKMCADEWAPFAVIYGGISSDGQNKSIDFDGLHGAPVAVENPQFRHQDQGRCRTFATWGEISGFSSLEVAREILDDAPSSKLSCFPCPGSFSPATIEKISDRGLEVLRKSDFLFARKFSADTVTQDQFERIILSA